MSLKKLFINAGLAGLWAAVAVLSEDPRIIALIPLVRLAIGWVAQRLNKPVPVDQ